MSWWPMTRRAGLLFIAVVACGCDQRGTPLAAPTSPTTVAPPTIPTPPTREIVHVTGRVVDGDGKPVDGARITQWDLPNTSVSDANGAFDLAISVGPLDRSFWVTVQKAGYETSELNRPLEAAATTLLRLHAIRSIGAGESFSGVITHDDSSCGYHWGYLCRRIRVMPDARGTLMLEVVSEGGVAVGMPAGAVGFPQTLERRISIPAAAGSVIPIEIAVGWPADSPAGFTLNSSLTP